MGRSKSKATKVTKVKRTFGIHDEEGAYCGQFNTRVTGMTMTWKLILSLWSERENDRFVDEKELIDAVLDRLSGEDLDVLIDASPIVSALIEVRATFGPGASTEVINAFLGLLSGSCDQDIEAEREAERSWLWERRPEHYYVKRGKRRGYVRERDLTDWEADVVRETDAWALAAHPLYFTPGYRPGSPDDETFFI